MGEQVCPPPDAFFEQSHPYHPRSPTPPVSDASAAGKLKDQVSKHFRASVIQCMGTPDCLVTG